MIVCDWLHFRLPKTARLSENNGKHLGQVLAAQPVFPVVVLRGDTLLVWLTISAPLLGFMYSSMTLFSSFSVLTVGDDVSWLMDLLSIEGSVSDRPKTSLLDCVVVSTFCSLGPGST